MNKIKFLLLFVCIAGCIMGCKKNEVFDVDAQFTLDTTAIRTFINSNNIPAIKDSRSGIFYQIITPGEGNTTYYTNTTVTANYTGSLLNGTSFDDSKGTPVPFRLDGVIAGWQLGIPLIQKGGRIRLLIPSYYGYGNISKGGIPPNSVLDFMIDLVDVQ